MRNYLFMKPVLELIARGELFTRVFATLIRVSAVILIVGGVVTFVAGMKVISDMPAKSLLGGLFFELILVVAVYAIAHTMLIRARHVLDLPGGDFVVVPIGSILIRMAGEIYALAALAFAVGFGIPLMFGREWFPSAIDVPVSSPLPHPTDASLIGGFLFLAIGLVYAFAALLIAYLTAELIVALVDLAKNMRLTRNLVEKFDREHAKGPAS